MKGHRVRCTVPSVLAGEINGVPFSGEPGFLLSDEMDAAAAEALAEVPGYELVEEDGAEEPFEAPDTGVAEAASGLYALPAPHDADLAAAVLAECNGYGRAPDAEPTSAPAPVTGDTNGDGKLSAAEKRAAKKAAAATPPQQ